MDNRQILPQREEKDKALFAWKTAIGLLAIEGICPSDRLIEIAVKHLEGEVTLNQAQVLLNNYHTLHPAGTPEDRSEKADLLSARIAKLLLATSFSISFSEYVSIQKELFLGISATAGQLRAQDASREEWVLNGAPVFYKYNPRQKELSETLFEKEKKLMLEAQPKDRILRHLARLASGIFRMRMFDEGNTLTLAVFLLRYLSRLGQEITNEVFARNAAYFRNALVRATYENASHGIERTTEYLEGFFKNLLFGEGPAMDNDALYLGDLLQQAAQTETERLTQDLANIKAGLEGAKQYTGTGEQDIPASKQDIESVKQDIEPEEQDIHASKQDIESLKQDIELSKQDIRTIEQDIESPEQDIEILKQDIPDAQKQDIPHPVFSAKTLRHIETLKASLPEDAIFGRTEVVAILQITPSPASTFLQKLRSAGILEPVTGHGKGKYRFC